MGLIHVCEDVEEVLPEGNVADIGNMLQWEGHEAESWLASRDILEIDQWVRGMCETGCKAYNTTPMCPSNLPDLKEVEEIFSGYDLALIIKYEGFKKWKDKKSTVTATSLSELQPEDRVELSKRKELRLKIRGISNGIVEMGYDTFPMSAGHCRLCEPPSCHQKECRQPNVSMPAIEGMGVHVFRTMEKLGHEMHYMPLDYTEFSFYNAILISTKD